MNILDDPAIPAVIINQNTKNKTSKGKKNKAYWIGLKKKQVQKKSTLRRSNY